MSAPAAAGVPDSDTPRFVTAEEAAREVGHIRWWERRAAALLGGWARTSTDSAWIATWFDLSAHCAWRAERWAEWAPKIAVLEPGSLVVPRNSVVADEFAALERLNLESGDGPGMSTEPVEATASIDVAFGTASLDGLRARRWSAGAIAEHRAHLEDLAVRADEVANRPLLRGILLSLADLGLDEARVAGVPGSATTAST